MTSPLPRVTSITGPDGGPVDVCRCLNAILPTVTVNITHGNPAGAAAQAAFIARALDYAAQQRPPVYDLRCEHGHGDLSSHMKAGDLCRWDEGECGSVLQAVAQ